MRVVVERKEETVTRGGAQVPQQTETRTVQFGKEDLLLVFIVALILVGLALGKLTWESALAYIGVSTSGGVWGLLSGTASGK